jgi:hypothetical protein
MQIIKDKIFSADDRNHSVIGLNLARKITIEDLIATGRQAEMDNTIEAIEASKLIASITQKLYENSG